MLKAFQVFIDGFRCVFHESSQSATLCLWIASSREPICIDSWLNQSGEDHVCIAGLSQLGRASPSSFWHFMRGFFIEAEGCRVAVSQPRYFV